MTRSRRRRRAKPDGEYKEVRGARGGADQQPARALGQTDATGYSCQAELPSRPCLSSCVSPEGRRGGRFRSGADCLHTLQRAQTQTRASCQEAQARRAGPGSLSELRTGLSHFPQFTSSALNSHSSVSQGTVFSHDGVLPLTLTHYSSLPSLILPY